MPYSFGHFLLAARLFLQGWSEKYYRKKDLIFTKILCQGIEKKALWWRFSAPSAGLDLAGSKGNRHTFARPITASGSLRVPLLTTTSDLLPPPV